jgi:hypothetical protein
MRAVSLTAGDGELSAAGDVGLYCFCMALAIYLAIAVIWPADNVQIDKMSFAGRVFITVLVPLLIHVMLCLR